MTRLLAVLLSLAGLLLFTMSGQIAAQAQGADDPAQVEAGKAVFETNCAGCHSVDGTGSSRGRPLTGIASQGDRETHVASVTNGKGGMPAWGEILSEEEIDAAVSYVRLTFVEAPAAAAADDAAADDAAAETTSAETTELALTGTNSSQLAVAGIFLLAVGMQLLAFSRRTTD